jgi:hypothetical protein
MPDLENFMRHFSGVHIIKLYASCTVGVMLDNSWAAGTVNNLQPPPAPDFSSAVYEAKQNSIHITSLVFLFIFLVIIVAITPYHRRTSACLQVSVSRAGSAIYRSLLYYCSFTTTI